MLNALCFLTVSRDRQQAIITVADEIFQCLYTSCDCPRDQRQETSVSVHLLTRNQTVRRSEGQKRPTPQSRQPWRCRCSAARGLQRFQAWGPVFVSIRHGVFFAVHDMH